MNCVLYARVSTDKQADKELSIPAQLREMQAYARQHGWQVVAEYVEPGASARTSARPELQRLLSFVREATEPVGVVLVHKIDRLARNVHDHAMIKAVLQQRGVRLASVVENVDESVSGELIENIMASIAQFYSANLSEEVKKGMRQKVMKGGWPHRPPRGYVLIRAVNGHESVIEVHPKDGPLMKRAFELYATGWYSLKALARRLHREGLQAASGGPIPQAHLRRLLASSFYAGLVHWHDLECPGTHAALISRELFEKVKRVLQQRYKNPGPKGSVIAGFPLRGLAICASCRGRMTGERHGKWKYYRCSRQTFRRELCSARSCNVKRAHSGVEQISRQVRLDKNLADDILESARHLIIDRVTTASVHQEQLEKETQALTATEMRLTAAFTAGDVAPNRYQKAIGELRTKRQQLNESSGKTIPTADQLVESISRTLQLATSLWDLYEPLNDVRRAALLRQLFEVIVLDHNGVAGFILKSPFDQLVRATETGANPRQLAQTVLDAA